MIRPPRHLSDFAGIRQLDPEPCRWLTPLGIGCAAGAVLCLALGIMLRWTTQ